MKKEYIEPRLLEIVIRTGALLAGSGEITRNDENDEATVTPGEGTYKGNDWAARAWQEDEEEEEF